jgi:hypothetical protein
VKAVETIKAKLSIVEQGKKAKEEYNNRFDTLTQLIASLDN